MIKMILRNFLIFTFLYILARPVWYVMYDAYGLLVAMLLINIPLVYVTIKISEDERKINAGK